MTSRQRCTATSRRTGQQCGAWAEPYQQVCRWHGALSPQALRAAEGRRVEAEARQVLEAHGVESVVDPLAELESLMAEAASWKNLLANEVERLRELENTNNFNATEVRAVVAAYERSVERLGKLLLEYARLGIAERRVRLAEQQAQLVAGVVEAALMATDPTPDKLMIGRQVAAQRLGELVAGHG